MQDCFHPQYGGQGWGFKREALDGTVEVEIIVTFTEIGSFYNPAIGHLN